MNKFKLASLNIAITIELLMIFLAIIIIILFSMDMYITKVVEPLNYKADYHEQEVSFYNGKINSCIGEEVKGSEIKSLIDNIISQNEENIGLDGKFIGIKVEENSIEGFEEYEELEAACKKASIYNIEGEFIEEYYKGNNDQINVNYARKLMQQLKTKISSFKSYSVKDILGKDGFYVWIIIKENKIK
jgi:hypothetical protein